MKKLITALCIFAMLISAVAYAAPLRLGVVPWAGFSPADVAFAKGFWKELGTDVEITSYESNTDMKNALVYKRVDFAIEVTGVWVGLHMEDVPVTILAEIDWSFGGDQFIMKKDKSPQTLKGQAVGVFSDAAIPLVYKYFGENSLRLSDVRFVEMDAEELPGNFISGRFAAVVCFDQYALRAVKDGNGTVAATSATYPGCIRDSFGARSDVLKNVSHADLVNLFRGWIKAVDWLGNPANWEEYKQILNQRTFKAAYSDSELRAMVEGVRVHDADMLQKQNQDKGGMDVYLEEFKIMLREKKELKKDFSVQDIFDNSAVMEALGKGK